MRKSKTLLKSNFFRGLLMIGGFTGACFVFQSCYGVPPNRDEPFKPDSTDVDSTGGRMGMDVDIEKAKENKQS